MPPRLLLAKQPGDRALPSSTHALLHATGRNRRRRAGHGNTSGWVDDGDGVAGARGGRLVNLHGRLLGLVGGRVEGRRAGVEGEAGSDLLRLLGGGRLRRVAGE